MDAPVVAIVDDDEAKRYILARRLKVLGLAARELATGAEAVEQAGAPALAWVLDVRLPDRDGLELCAELRARGVAAPIFVQSAKLKDEPERARARQAGATGLFTDGQLEQLLQALEALKGRGA